MGKLTAERLFEPFGEGAIKLLLNSFNNGVISFGKFVEILNSTSQKYTHQQTEELQKQNEILRSDCKSIVKANESLQKKADELDKMNKKYIFMIENGLGLEDLKNDIDKYPH